MVPPEVLGVANWVFTSGGGLPGASKVRNCPPKSYCCKSGGRPSGTGGTRFLSVGACPARTGRKLKMSVTTIADCISIAPSQNFCPARVGNIDAKWIDTCLALVLGRVERDREVSLPAVGGFHGAI